MATNLNKMAPMDKMATMDKMAAMELDRPVTPSLGIPMEMTPGQIMEAEISATLLDSPSSPYNPHISSPHRPSSPLRPSSPHRPSTPHRPSSPHTPSSPHRPSSPTASISPNHLSSNNISPPIPSSSSPPSSPLQPLSSQASEDKAPVPDSVFSPVNPSSEIQVNQTTDKPVSQPKPKQQPARLDSIPVVRNVEEALSNITDLPPLVAVSSDPPPIPAAVVNADSDKLNNKRERRSSTRQTKSDTSTDHRSGRRKSGRSDELPESKRLKTDNSPETILILSETTTTGSNTTTSGSCTTTSDSITTSGSSTTISGFNTTSGSSLRASQRHRNVKGAVTPATGMMAADYKSASGDTVFDILVRGRKK